MIAYKGFHPGLICRGYQFVMGLNVTEKANCRANGFHCAANPLDCLSYYSDMEQSEYYLVDAGGDIDEDGSDTKISCTHLTIIQKLSRTDFFLHALAYMVDHPNLKWNGHVKKDTGCAQYGFAVVRGPQPAARGKLNDILALAKEDPQTGKIVQIAMAAVDGATVMPDTWYDVDFIEREVLAA